MAESSAPKRTAADVVAEIERTLSTVDGISTADAFKLGQLVREYGQLQAGEAVGPLMTAILDGIGKPTPPKKPWETP